MWPSARCGSYVFPSLTTNIHYLEIVSEILVMPVNLHNFSFVDITYISEKISSCCYQLTKAMYSLHIVKPGHI